MAKNLRWLQDEIQVWLRQGLLEPEQASKILALYKIEDDPAWGKVIFAAIGAIIFGLGIILLFAYNWDGMHRFSKLASVILAMAGTYASAYIYSSSSSAHKKIGESLYLLGTMLFGAGIWLVAQIYHIDEHYPNAILVWCLGALAIAWVSNSSLHSLFALALLGLWHWMEVIEFNNGNLFSIWLLGIGVLPLVWLQRSRVGLFFACVLFMFIYSASYATLSRYTDGTLLVVMLMLSSALLLVSFLSSKTSFNISQNVIRSVGVLVFSVLIFICSFSEVDDIRFGTTLGEINATVWFYFWLPFVLNVGLLVLLLTKFREFNQDKTDLIEIFIMLACCLVALLAVFFPPVLSKNSWVIYALIFPVYCVVLIYRGTLYLRWQTTALGSLLLSAYTIARFMDLFESLLLRACVFLVLGALLFAIGIYYSKQKQKSLDRQRKLLADVQS